MTTISASVIADSISTKGIRLTTMQLRYPRWIHAEGRTHRLVRWGEEEVRTPSLMEDEMLSRNASSSRAIPVKRLIQDVIDDPAVPMFWGKNQKGMQAGEEHNAEVIVGFGSDDYVFGSREEAWLVARDNAIQMARAFDDAGYHKQVVNRLLEPFSHINVVVTATEWDNFFLLRDHEDAEPHIALLARRMREAMENSKPKLLLDHEWHTPYWGTREDNDRLWTYGMANNIEGSVLQLMARQISAARCARVSYLTHDGKPTEPEDDVKLFQQLTGSGPIKHLSPLEHVARPNRELWSGNFRGWRQLRKDFE